MYQNINKSEADPLPIGVKKLPRVILADASGQAEYPSGGGHCALRVVFVQAAILAHLTQPTIIYSHPVVPQVLLDLALLPAHADRVPTATTSRSASIRRHLVIEMKIFHI